jgi:hypothetical protein
MEYREMSDDDLERLSQQLDHQRMQLREQMKAIAIELDRRATMRRLRGLSEHERARLVQVLTDVGGIDSTEGLGIPGGQ